MRIQDMISALLLLFLGFMGNALGVAVRADGHPALIPSGLSHSTLAAQANISWTPVTETYVTTSLDVIQPVNRTQTYTELSTELTTTLIDVGMTTQTVVEIAGYSTIGTHTTTFLAPASSSTYSAIETITDTSLELLVPSIGTLTLTGNLTAALGHPFATPSGRKRAAAWGSFDNATGVQPYRNPAKPLAWDSFTAEPTGVSSHLRAATIEPGSVPSGRVDHSLQMELVKERTKSSSTKVIVITVTNTYSVTPTSEHRHKTTSKSKTSTSRLILSPANLNSTHHLSETWTIHNFNTSAIIYTTPTMLVSDTGGMIVQATTAEVGTTAPSKGTGTANPSSTSGGSVIFDGLVLRLGLAILAMTVSFVG